MNPEQQRIAIAEAHGWKEIRAEVDWLPGELTGIFTWPHPTDAEKTKYFINRKPVPNYPYDLNAMHEVEKIIPRQLFHVDYWQKGYGRFQQILSGLTITPYSATAAQRAEAFLRTIGKWEESR